MSTQTVTVGVRGLVVTALVVLGLLVAYLLGGGGGSSPAEAAPPEDEAAGARTLTMAGTGEAVAVPDQLGFSVSISALRDDVSAAMDEASRQQTRVLAALADHGVRRGDVQTSGLSMNPVYDYPAYSSPVLRGYRVTQRATVLVTDLGEAGAALATAVRVGGNGTRVGDVRLRVGDPEAALAKARRAAVEAATAKAEEYAGAAGQELGDVLTLREVTASAPVEQAELRTSAYATADRALKAVPIRTGREELSVNVEVVWRLAG